MNFKKSTFDVEPTLVHMEGRVMRICFDVEKTTIEPSMEEEEPREVYLGYVVRLEQPIERGRIVDAIVTAGYPNDVMQATVNNYLLDPTDEEHKAEFEDMQNWRTKAKSVASEVLASI